MPLIFSVFQLQNPKQGQMQLYKFDADGLVVSIKKKKELFCTIKIDFWLCQLWEFVLNLFLPCDPGVRIQGDDVCYYGNRFLQVIGHQVRTFMQLQVNGDCFLFLPFSS